MERSGSGLTGRQVEILQWMADGKTGPEIAEILGIALTTTRQHRQKVLIAFGVFNSAAAVAEGFRRRLIK